MSTAETPRSAISRIRLLDVAWQLTATWSGPTPTRAATPTWSTAKWVEFLLDTGSPVCAAVDELLGGNLAICDAIRSNAAVLHADTDFAVLAHAPLTAHPAGTG